MHEFSLAQDIMGTIGRNVAACDMAKLAVIHIEVGEFAGVVVDSLEFGLQMVLQDKNLGSVKIDITRVPAFAVCECKNEYQIKDILESCPVCGSYNRTLTSGKDVIIKSIELSD
jgi:hydrogenase nickel incorporation protein HypA/HybF